MAVSDYFESQENPKDGYAWSLSVAPSGWWRLVEELADRIVEGACHKRDLYETWREVRDGLTTWGASDREVFQKGVIGPLFGVPSRPTPDDHLQGAIAEFLWFFITKAGTYEGRLLHLTRPKSRVTTQGGDGMEIRVLQRGSVRFRLWEIKKAVGTSTVSGACSTAYRQLDERALEYLAEYARVMEESRHPDVAALAPDMPTLWVDADDRASPGVAVTSTTMHQQGSYFNSFKSHFEQFKSPSRIRGAVILVPEYPKFCSEVRAEVWKGL